MIRFLAILSVFLGSGAVFTAVSAAQETAPAAQSELNEGEELIAALPDPSVPAPGMTRIEREINEKLAYLQPNIDVNTMPSLFMSLWEHDLVLDARKGLITRDPISDDGIAASTEAGPRDVSLGGIVYLSRKEWTVWINSMRVSPSAIPEQVMDLRVFKDYIELEWFDESTNQIFPIRLRPHQRFNLDTRMFLPG